MQNLFDVALGDLFPTQCGEWLSLKQDIREIFGRERTEKGTAFSRDIANTKDPLHHALREEVVSRVISIFPYVLFQCVDHMLKVFSWYRSFDRGGLSSTVGEIESTDLLFPAFA